MNVVVAEPARLFSSLDSLEGVPDWFEPRVKPAAAAAGGAWRRQAYDVLAWLGDVLPGVGLAALIAYAGKLLADLGGAGLARYDPARFGGGSPVSPILLAILIGLLVRNAVGVPTAYEHGLRLSLKTILRVGIVLLGLKLTVFAIAGIGAIGIPVIVGTVTAALLVVASVTRVFRLPRRLGTLIGVGTSVCGVSAIVATAPAIDADEDETSYAVATITVFGLAALLTYPLLAHWVFDGDPVLAGLFLGTAIHDTSQVAGAGLLYGQQYASEGALKTAMAVKLMRNLSMSLLIPLLAVVYHRSTSRADGTSPARAAAARRQPWHHVVPGFVLGFALMACLRSVGDIGPKAFGVLDRAAWDHVVGSVDVAAVSCLTVAMAAVGLGTGFARLRGMGCKPFAVGFAAAAAVGVVSVSLIKLLVLFTAAS